MEQVLRSDSIRAVKRILGVVAAFFCAIAGMAIAAGAQNSGQQITVKPSSVAQPGTYDLDIGHSGFTAGSVNLAVCTTADETVQWNAANLVHYCGGFGRSVQLSGDTIREPGVNVTGGGITVILFELKAGGERAEAVVRVVGGTGRAAASTPATEPTATPTPAPVRDVEARLRHTQAQLELHIADLDDAERRNREKQARIDELEVQLGAAKARISDLEAGQALRDNLIRTQEDLLNAYRCQFDVDTDSVPGGCP